MSDVDNRQVATAAAMPKETWKEIPGIPGREVSSSGRIRRTDTGGIVSQHVAGSGGYRGASIRSKKYYIHDLVARAWLGNRPSGMDVNHIDGNKANNAPDNLEYVTRKENMSHAKRIGIWDNSGVKHPMATATDEEVLYALKLIDGGMMMKDAAASIGVNAEVIGKIRRGERRKYLNIGPQTVIHNLPRIPERRAAAMKKPTN